jgi:hypothetical protein
LLLQLLQGSIYCPVGAHWREPIGSSLRQFRMHGDADQRQGERDLQGSFNTALRWRTHGDQWRRLSSWASSCACKCARLPYADLTELRAAVHAMGDKVKYEAHADFTIFPIPPRP